MKFKQFGKMKPLADDKSSFKEYLNGEVAVMVQELNTGLSRLRVDENFNGYRFSREDGNKTVNNILVNSDNPVELRHNLNSPIDHFLILNGIAGVLLTESTNKKKRNNVINLQLDTDIYAGGIEKEVDIILFK